MEPTSDGVTGSSPRMRGTLQSVAGHLPQRGIIPAYAGNTGRAQRARPSEWDHPRVCGEHYTAVESYQVLPGSSPRMRGTHFNGDSQVGLLGIIPAYAGNTSPVS